MPSEIDQLIDAFIIYCNLLDTDPRRPDLSWTFDELTDYLLDEPEVCWKLIQKMCRRDLSEKVEIIFACGFLEVFVRKYANDYIDEMERFAEHEPKLKELLGGVWNSNAISTDTWSRLEQLRGKPWGP